MSKLLISVFFFVLYIHVHTFCTHLWQSSMCVFPIFTTRATSLVLLTWAQWSLGNQNILYFGTRIVVPVMATRMTCPVAHWIRHWFILLSSYITIIPHINKRPVGLLSFAPFGPFWVRGEDSGQCLGSNWCFWRCGKNDEAIHRGKWLQLLTHLPLEKSRHFGDNILWCILVNEKYHILVKSYSELEESLDFLIVSCFNVSIFLIKEFATLVRPCFE